MKRYAGFIALFMSAVFCTVTSYAQFKIVTSVAGAYIGGTYTSGSGVPAISTLISGATGVATDTSDNVYLVEEMQPRIRKVDQTTGLIYIIAGAGVHGFSGDGGPATAAIFDHPQGICTDRAGNVYVVDAGNYRIRKIDAVTQYISTVAGNGSVGSTGNGGPATSAAIGAAKCVAVDGSGVIYIADASGAVRKVDPITGIITSAGFSTNWLVIDASNNLYFCSGGIKKKDALTGLVTTVTSSIINSSFCRDVSGNIYYGTSGMVWMIDISTGHIDSIAGCGSSYDEGIPALDAYAANYMFCSDKHGNIYYSNNVANVRKISISSGFSTVFLGSSYNMRINLDCSGIELRFKTNHYFPGMTFKTYFGDGQIVSTSINPACNDSGIAVLRHNYSFSGTYTLKTVLFSGTVPVDSMRRTIVYTFCNTIPLTYYYDIDSNCIKSTFEPFIFLPNLTEVDSNGIPIDTLTCTSGMYYTAKGISGDIYKFKPILLAPGLKISCLAGGLITDTLNTTTYTGKENYFGINTNSSFGVFDFQLFNTNRPGPHLFRSHCIITNNCSTPISPTLDVQTSSKYIFYSAIPGIASSSGSNMRWNFGSVTSTMISPIHVSISMAKPPGGPDYMPGDTVNSTSIIGPLAGDNYPIDNFCVRVDTIKSGYDPNFIDVIPAGRIISGTKLQYAIEFENTGNDTAFNIYVLDTLSGYLDPSSLRIAAASARMDFALIKSGAYTIAKFDFPGINLLDSSHHNQCTDLFFFTINTLPGLPNGTIIPNRAGIYFDDNEVVMTNTVNNIISFPEEVPVVRNEKTETIFPNPATDILTINANKETYTSFTVTNSFGQLLMQDKITQTQTKVNVKSLPAGLYYISLRGEHGTVVKKLVKM